jgi:hypothetical protein
MNGSRVLRFALRAGLIALAGLHSLPAQKHLTAFAAHPSLIEGWKGFGSAIAVVLYLLPLRLYVQGLGWLWANARRSLTLLGWTLAFAHAVPASDHLPRLLQEASFGDAWRGIGSALACAWFLMPLPFQGRAIRELYSAARFTTEGRIVERLKLAALVVTGLVAGGIAGSSVARGSSLQGRR